MNTNRNTRVVVATLIVATLISMFSISGLFNPEDYQAAPVSSYQVSTAPDMYSAPVSSYQVSTTLGQGINAHDPRTDACRTYRFGGYDATDGIQCGTKGVHARIAYQVVIVPTTVVEVTTVVIVPPATPAPPVVPVVVDDDDDNKTCKNKNSGKDGTPEECNAGIGQEKEKKNK